MKDSDRAAIRARFTERLEGSIAAVAGLKENLDAVAEVAVTVVEALDGGGTILTCGNGGSAAQALHLAEELIGRYSGDRPAKRAVCLNADPTALTCIGNDYGFAEIFARQCSALAGPGDILVVFSTSGRSANVLRAVDVANERGATTIGLLGGDGGPCAGRVRHAIVAPGSDSAQVQEAHQVVIHLLCEWVEVAGG